MAVKRLASVKRQNCVSCGTCEAVCPRGAAQVKNGCFAEMAENLCIGCGLCAKSCPTSCIHLVKREAAPGVKVNTSAAMASDYQPKRFVWYDYLWLWAIFYFTAGFFNILFAWLGMIDFLLPLAFAIIGGNKFFCNHLCGRGQLFLKLGKKLKCSRNRPTPFWFYSRWFRYGFLIFFLLMFANMLFQTWLVFAGSNSLNQTISLFWTFSLPLDWAYTATSTPAWVAQFSFGFYSIMLTSFILGLIMMAFYKPRSWCAFCPMGAMTQGICQLKNRAKPC